ncbi:hypothetical protein HQ587_06325 [bacterium]|nr:hypothetical protein [bacterium]
MKNLFGEETWIQCSKRLKDKEVLTVLQALFDHIVNTLATRIDDIRTGDGRAISFFQGGREFLTINITHNNLRIYIHSSAQVLFDPATQFRVERFSLWKSSYQKSSGKFRAMSVWISKAEFLEGVREIIGLIPKNFDK